MQTFLPSADFEQSAALLDWRRLGKQRVEAWQIMLTLRTRRRAWANHPAVRMWRGHEQVLAQYGIAMCREWKRRGYKDTLLPRFRRVLQRLSEGTAPGWLGNPGFHASHRSNLLRKEPNHYRSYWPDEPDDLPYVWPA